MRRQLATAWGDFLSQFHWDWFLTLTFREPTQSFRAHRLFREFARDLDKAAGPPVASFRADERGERTGRFHMHALMLNVAHLRRLTFMDRWTERAGFAHIRPYDQRRGAAYYCAKYVAKSLGEWELVGLPVAVQMVFKLEAKSAACRRRRFQQRAHHRIWNTSHLAT